MTLKKASLFLIFGLIYTIFHKLLFAVFPALNQNVLIKNLTLILGLFAASAIILFACIFIRDFPYILPVMKISLSGIIVFTSIILITKITFSAFNYPDIVKRLIFNPARILNSFCMILFLSNFLKLLKADSDALKIPAGLAILGTALGLLMELGGFVFFLIFLITGYQAEYSSVFMAPAFIIFLFTNTVFIIFLINFGRINDFRDIISSS